MQVVTQFPRAVREEPDMGIVLADGTRLSARVWMPRDAADDPVPAILEFLPYRKRDGTAARDALTHPWFAGHGYACLRVDMRGNGDSEGLMADEYTPQELSDACEVIAWAAAQPWCSGSVGMMGISWGGFNGLQVAALAPEALKAVVSLCSTVDRYADDIHFKGGCLLNENLGWGATMWAYSSRPPDPALRADWREMWLARLAGEPFLPAVWLAHQRRDAYWRHGSVCEDFGAIRAAVMAVGGWGDSYKNAVPQLVAQLDAPVRGIIGPWVHKYPHFAVPEPRIGFLQEARRWWDRWLKGTPNGVEDGPPLAMYLMDGVRPAAWYEERPGRWIAEDGSGIAVRELALSERGLGRAEGADFAVTVQSPQHCGAEGGEFCAIWLGPEMPGDQRADDAFSACFDTEPMAAVDIVGAPVLRLRVASDRPVAQIAVRLNHVHPDGASTRITWGVLNLTRRDSMAAPEALVPGQIYDIAVPLDHIAYRLPEGHRLRVAVSSAYWPMIWPSPEPVCLTLAGGALALPVREGVGGKRSGAADEVVFPPAQSAEPLKTREIRAAQHQRRSETDRQTGVVTLMIEDDFGEAEDLGHGLISGAVAREKWVIHPDDPLAAKGETHWTEVVERDGMRLRTETFAGMTCTKDRFVMTARVEAYEGNRLVYERNVSEEVPRDMM